MTTYQLLREQFQQPVLVETFLPGREVTVGIVGNGSNSRVVGVMEFIFTDQAEAAAFTALEKQKKVEGNRERIFYRLVTDEEPLAVQARQLALAAYHTLGCRDVSRVDLRCDVAGFPCFLEMNPLPGLNPVFSELPIMAELAGLSYVKLIDEIVESAWERYKCHNSSPRR